MQRKQRSAPVSVSKWEKDEPSPLGPDAGKPEVVYVFTARSRAALGTR